jgi:DNA-binding transcriptional MocR family regulator
LVTRFSFGVPDNALIPIQKLNKSLQQAMLSLSGNGTGYEEVQGNRKLRKYIARWSFTWGGNFSEDDLVTTAGAMNAISYLFWDFTTG